MLSKLARSRHTGTADGIAMSTSGQAIVVRVLYPSGVKPSKVLGAIEAERRKLNISMVAVEYSAGVYNGEGALRSEPLPSAFEIIGCPNPEKGIDDARAWENAKLFAQFWAFHQFGEHCPVMPDRGRVQRAYADDYGACVSVVRDRVHPHAPAPKDAPKVERSIRERRREGNVREAVARERREAANRIPETSKRSPYAEDGKRVARERAEWFMLTVLRVHPDDEPGLCGMIADFTFKNGRLPTSVDELR